MKKFYEVVEYVYGDEENATGYYSSLENAQQGILDRVKESYTDEEMENFHFSEDGHHYSTTENEFVVSCEYVIYEHNMNEWSL